jgi:predicted GNAT family N-acyltransferase
MITQIYEENFPQYLRSKNRLFKKTLKDYDYVDLMTDRNEYLLAFGLLNYYPSHRVLHLDYMSLHSSHQGHGNGSKYLNQLIDTYLHSSTNQSKYMILECEDHLVPFYLKNNFHKMNYNYKFDGMTLNLMLYGPKMLPSIEVGLAAFLMGQFLTHDCDEMYIIIYLVIRYILSLYSLMFHFIVLVWISTLKSVYF